MFATTSPTMRHRSDADSFHSNPDEDTAEDGNDNYLSEDAAPGGFMRPPSFHRTTPRPPRESYVRESLRRSLVVPAPEPPRQSFIPYSEFGYRETLPPQTPRERSFYSSYVENMEIHPSYEEFARREYPPSRPNGLWRLANALLRPFRSIKSIIRVPNFLARKRSAARRPATQTSDWIRDPTAVPPSTRMQYSNEGVDRTPENVTMIFPTPSVAPSTMIGAGADHGRNHRSGRESSEGTNDAHEHSTNHHFHSHSPHRSPHHSAQAHTETNTAKPNGHVRGSGTNQTITTPQTDRSPSSPAEVRASTIKESSRGRWSQRWSYMSRGSSLVHHVIRLCHALRALYHLPWVATPPMRVAVDIIPAMGARSKYSIHRSTLYPPNVMAAAIAAKNMQPSEGKSWYQPSPQQIAKQLKRRKGLDRHHHSRPEYPFSPYDQLLMGDSRFQPQRSGTINSQPMFMFNPAFPPFPLQGAPYGAQQYYMAPSPSRPPTTSGGNGGPRVPPPARPTRSPSLVSFSMPTPRPGPRPVQSNPDQAQQILTSPDPDVNFNPNNNSTIPNPGPGRGDVHRPPPVANAPPMYVLVQGPPFPPSYGNVFQYPYTPPWTPPQRI